LPDNSDYALRPSEKLDVLYRLFRGENICDLIDNMDNTSVIGLQKFMWETAAEFGIISRKHNFSRKEITRKMKPTQQFQKEQNCDERIYFCKGTHCIHSNSECARKKIKEHIKVMSESIREYIETEQHNETFVQSTLS